jgi:uncharacterized RDD family membrane protein YckC
MYERKTELSDQLSIDTPELVALEFPLAGLGSRFLALLVDYFLQVLFFWGIIVLLAFSGAARGGGGTRGFSSISANWTIAIVIFVLFMFQWGYFTLFEAFWNGQTPGKRFVQLRVIQKTGRSISLFESMSRNLIRIVDAMPTLYIAGAICIFFSPRHQRLGDLVAGTLVVHTRKVEETVADGSSTRIFTAAVLEPPVEAPKVSSIHFPADAVARLSLEDLQLIESFLARRLDLPLDVRASLRGKLARRLSEKMQFPIPDGVSVETFLEEIPPAIRSVGAIRG